MNLAANIAVDGKVNTEEAKQRLRKTPLSSSAMFSNIASAINFSDPKLHRYTEDFETFTVRRLLNSILSVQNIKNRLMKPPGNIFPNSHGQSLFENFKDTVHIDEKWFYICEKSWRYYLNGGEEVLH